MSGKKPHSKGAKADDDPQDDVRSVVARYYSVVADSTSVPDDLAPLLAKRVTLQEHPNPISPHGSSRGREETLASFLAGRDLFRGQQFDVHEILVVDDRAAVRATWRGTIGVDAGPLGAGTELTAHVAAFITVKDGQIVTHETFDCYEPFT